MFEVNTFTPAQFGAFFGFLTAYRGDLNVLIHPNTDDELADHVSTDSLDLVFVPQKAKMVYFFLSLAFLSCSVAVCHGRPLQSTLLFHRDSQTTKATWVGTKLELKTEFLQPQARFGISSTTNPAAGTTAYDTGSNL